MEFKELDKQELDALIGRMEDAIEHDLALSKEDIGLLLSAIQTLALLQNKIGDQDITLTKLKKLLGMIKSSEKKDKPKSSQNKRPKPKKSSTPSSKSNKEKNFSTEQHKMQNLKKGDVCPACPVEPKGKLYKYTPLTFVRITAHAPYEGKKHVAERLRCNICQSIFTAEVPESLTEDGPIQQMYGYSARSAMSCDKFFSGLGYYHQETKGQFSGLSLPASTIFDQCEALSQAVTPAYLEIIKQASSAELYLLDDTTHRILTQEPQEKPIRNGQGKRLRTGVYCSGLIAYTPDDYELVLYEISLGHAGEFIDDILVKRPQGLPKPKVMSDALSSNTVTQIDIEKGYCNSHGRRNFVDVESKFPDQVAYVLDEYGKIWANEKKTQDLKLTPEKRLAYHKEHSLPVMEGLKNWCEKEQEKEDYEEHSALGKAIKYFLKHFSFLIAFCKILGMPIDNNRTEQTLKYIIRGRKSYMFFKTVAGATVANIITSLIMTAYRAKQSPFDYLIALQKYQSDLARRPSMWMPWNYQETIKELQQESEQKFSDAA